MIQAILPLLGGLTNLASEFIEDPDKKAEFEVRKLEIQQELLIALTQQETNPWVDGAVKLLTACVALIRPLASIAVFVYSAANPEYLGVLKAIDPTLAAIAGGVAFGSAPAWGISRHMEKSANKTQNGFINH